MSRVGVLMCVCAYVRVRICTIQSVIDGVLYSEFFHFPEQNIIRTRRVRQNEKIDRIIDKKYRNLKNKRERKGDG